MCLSRDLFFVQGLVKALGHIEISIAGEQIRNIAFCY